MKIECCNGKESGHCPRSKTAMSLDAAFADAGKKGKTLNDETRLRLGTRGHRLLVFLGGTTSARIEVAVVGSSTARWLGTSDCMLQGPFDELKVEKL